MSRFKWYRKLRGGHWVYYYFGWVKTGRHVFDKERDSRACTPGWSFEDYTYPKLISKEGA